MSIWEICLPHISAADTKILPPVQEQEHAYGDEQAEDRNGGRHDRHLQEAGGGVYVAGQTGQDAARLHLPQRRQRQVQEPLEERAPQRQHDPRVQHPLAVVLQDAEELGDDDHAEEHRPRQVQTGQSRRRIELVI